MNCELLFVCFRNT